MPSRQKVAWAILTTWIALFAAAYIAINSWQPTDPVVNRMAGLLMGVLIFSNGLVGFLIGPALGGKRRLGVVLDERLYRRLDEFRWRTGTARLQQNVLVSLIVQAWLAQPYGPQDLDQPSEN